MVQHTKNGTKKLFNKEILSAIAGWLIITTVLWIDLETGDRYRLGILYQLGVVLLAYNVNIWYALFAAFVCSILRPFSLRMDGHFIPSIDVPLVNSMVRFGMYLVTALITARLKKCMETQKKLEQELYDANQELSKLLKHQ